MTTERRISFFFLLFIAVITSLLYVPFLNNGIVFDDHGVFNPSFIYDAAQVLINLRPRTFPYFTLGFVQVESRSLEVNRICSLFLHIICSYLIYCLVKSLLYKTYSLRFITTTKQPLDRWQITIVAGVIASWFSIHPIAVYGAAYLTQRTILFATLFSLLSLLFFCRAFAKNRTADVATAAAFYTLAVFSKEHAIMLPVAAVAFASLYEGDFRSHFKRVLIYLLLCLPAAVTVYLATKNVVLVSYEPDVTAVVSRMSDISAIGKPGGQWLVSALMQAGFFFDYLKFWIVPDIRFLSADMRFDFIQLWSSWWLFPKAIFFAVSPIVFVYFLRKKGLISLFFCGFLYCWLLFLTELVSVRFQEPFVLYRSYLWAPGYAIMFAAIIAAISCRWIIATAIPIFIVLFMCSQDRLSSLTNESSVWKDAANKLVSSTVIGSDRIFYNRGLAYLREKKYEDAIADFSRTIQQSPHVSQAYYNRALGYFNLTQYTAALSDLDSTIYLNKKDSSAQYMRGVIFEKNNCLEKAELAYSASALLGNRIAKLKMDSIKNNIVSSDTKSGKTLNCAI